MTLTNVVGLFDTPKPIQAQATRFEEIWTMWPVKAKKPLAKAKYDAIIQGQFKTRTLDKDSGCYVDIELTASEAEIIAGAKAFLSSQIDKNTYRFKDDGKYLPHLATWLNQGRFEDFQ